MKMMKLFSLFLFAALCCKSYAHESARNILSQSKTLENCHVTNHARMSDPQQSKQEKRYIDPNNIHFEQKEMYVQLDQNWVVANAVYTDTNGFYILETKGGWNCGNCGKYNEGNNWTCEKCGKRRE